MREWNKSYKIGNLTLKGYSVGGKNTCFYVPELRIFFDAGMFSEYESRYIFLTHCHLDHTLGLIQLITNKDYEPNIYVPLENYELFDNYILSSLKLLKSSNNIKYHNKKLFGIKQDDIIDISKEYCIKVYKLYHNIPTYGFGLMMKRKKLKEEFKKFSGKELAVIKKTNTITTTVYDKLIIYLTDTNINVLKNLEILQYKTIIIECTFLDDTDNNKHISWYKLKEYVIKYPNIKFILIHFSYKYQKSYISKFFKEQNLSNVYPWI